MPPLVSPSLWPPALGYGFQHVRPVEATELATRGYRSNLQLLQDLCLARVEDVDVAVLDFDDGPGGSLRSLPGGWVLSDSLTPVL
jgi:hypothetical protein